MVIRQVLVGLLGDDVEANKLLLLIALANLFSGHNDDRTLLDETPNNV
jgi:hypothetical protein